MDPVTQALRDPTLDDSLDELAHASAMGPHGRTDGINRVPPGTLTIDLDLPPVEAAPRHKGPRARLEMLKAWDPETWPPGPRRRAMVGQ
jgi:hypothetical protein